MLLENRNAIIYGAGGAIGRGVAHAFAREGATVHLTGRRREPLEQLAAEIGRGATAAVVDALDENAVTEHATGVAESAGGIDVSLNLISRGDVQGIPLAQMRVADLMRPVTTGLTSTFLTARAALPHMADRGRGVILALNSGSAHGSPMMGGTGLADAAIDTLMRNLALEVGPAGIRVVGMWAAGIPETLTPEKLGAVNPEAASEEALRGLLTQLAALRMTKRSPSLTEIAATATFLASDHAAGITGTWVNVTGGIFAS